MVLGGIVLGEHFDGIDAATWRLLLVGSTETCREIDVMHDVMLRMIVATQVGRPVGSVCLFLRKEKT